MLWSSEKKKQQSSDALIAASKGKAKLISCNFRRSTDLPSAPIKHKSNPHSVSVFCVWVWHGTVLNDCSPPKKDETWWDPKTQKVRDCQTQNSKQGSSICSQSFCDPKKSFSVSYPQVSEKPPRLGPSNVGTPKKNTMRPPVQVERTFFSRCPRIGRCKLWLRRWVLAPIFGAKDHGFDIFWVVVSNIFYFHPYLGKIPSLTNIFQMGWNHQLVL